MLKNELQSIISGKSKTSSRDNIQTVANFLRTSKETSVETKGRAFTAKEQETEKLIAFINTNNLWYHNSIPDNNKIGEGAEQKVYLCEDNLSVIKLNDSIFYLTWLDYFHNHSLTIHLT